MIEHSNDLLFLLKRKIDLSLLKSGFHIPAEFHSLVYMFCGELRHGDNIPIKITIGNETFDARMNNIGFDQTRYPNHPDLLQVRYSETSPIARYLQTIFQEEYQYLKQKRIELGPKRQVHLPVEFDSEIVVYGTAAKGVFVIECYLTGERKGLKEEMDNMTEEEFETITPRIDPKASIKEHHAIVRIRQLDRSIGDSLKNLYGYRCQMTGELVGEPYGVTCVEAHHIEPFIESLNNDTSNIIILSPSYHRIIHKAKPHFNRKTLTFEYPNGLLERVKYNKHLCAE